MRSRGSHCCVQLQQHGFAVCCGVTNLFESSWLCLALVLGFRSLRLAFVSSSSRPWYSHQLQPVINDDFILLCTSTVPALLVWGQSWELVIGGVLVVSTAKHLHRVLAE